MFIHHQRKKGFQFCYAHHNTLNQGIRQEFC